MKKRVLVLISMAFLLLLFITGCSKKPGADALTLKNGMLAWDKVEEAFSYEVDLGNGGKSVDDPSYDLTSAFEQNGTYTVTVRYVNAKGERKDIGSMEITAVSLDKPVINVQGSEEELFFAWAPVEGAASYSYDIHDGNGVRSAELSTEGDYRVPITNSTEQMISVVANGTSEENHLLISAESTYTYKDGRGFDMALLAQYTAVYTGKGEAQDTFRVGTTLTRGIYELEVSMYLMNSDGNCLKGNGEWGRRILSYDGQHFWFCENELDGWENSGKTIPNPDEAYTVKMKLSVDRGGNVLIPVYDFSDGERIVVADIAYNGKSVLNAEGGRANPVEEVEKLDVTALDKYLAVFRSPGGWYGTDGSTKDYEVELPTNLSDGTHNVKVTYCVCTASGDMLTGNGMWGRRIVGVNPKGGPYVWLNENDINSDYKAAEIPLPTQPKTSKFTVQVKDGKFTLTILDFNKDEMVLIAGVQNAIAPSGNGIFVSEGKMRENFKVKTTLTGKPRHTDVTLSITYKVSDVFGDRIEGNGGWGRRIATFEKLIWLCEDEVEGYPEAKGTIPNAGQEVTQEMTFREVNKFGFITLNMCDFNAGDVVEITSIKYNGQEILAE